MNSADPVTRTRILEAAEVQFRLFGPQKTSMEDIALKAGLSRATLYLHFSGKKAVYTSLLESINQQFLSEIESMVTASIEAPKKLRLFTELTATSYQDNPLLFAAIVEDDHFSMRQVAPELMTSRRSRILKSLSKIIRQGVKEKHLRKVNVEQTAYLMYELGNQLLKKELKKEAEYPLKDILNVMDDIIARGILA